jgi:hypothetical protein
MKQRSSRAVQPISQNPDTDWHILGEIEIPIGVNAQSTLDAWLMESLFPLNLHADFLNKIRKSAEDVATPSIQIETVQRTRLLIMIPANRRLNVQTWGHFRIEKVGLTAENENSPNHTIEFYLFPDGQ